MDDSEGPGDPGRYPESADDRPARLTTFRRQVDAMRWRLDTLRPDQSPSPAEVFEALETTMEELQVAVEELRLTNEALRDSRADVEAERRRYRDLFDLAPDAYLVTDLQGVVREANQAATVRLNIEARFLVGKPLVLFLPEEGRSAFRSEMSRLRDETGTAEYDLRLKPRQLPPFDASLRVGVVRDLWGQPAGLRWMIHDISARKRAEEKIRSLNAQLERRVVERSEQLESVLQTNERWLIKAHAADDETADGSQFFRDIVEEVDAILWRVDAESGRYTFVSRRAEELLGFPASRWLEDSNFWLDRIHPDDRAWASTYRAKHLREQIDHEAEYRVLASDGRAIWFREVVRVLKHEPDGPAVLYGLMVNISRRKKVERQLYTAKGELTLRLRDMTYLHELGGRLTTARGWRATLDEVLSAAISLQGADGAMLLLREPGRDDLAFAASFHLSADFVRVIEGGSVEASLTATLPLMIEDVETAAETSAWRQIAPIGGFRAVALVPLNSREGEPFGAVVTFFKTPYRMGEGQARLFEMYLEQAAESIEAARWLGVIEAKAAEMRKPLDAIIDAVQGGQPREPLEAQALLLAGLVEDLIDATRPGRMPSPQDS